MPFSVTLTFKVINVSEPQPPSPSIAQGLTQSHATDPGRAFWPQQVPWCSMIDAHLREKSQSHSLNLRLSQASRGGVERAVGVGLGPVLPHFSEPWFPHQHNDTSRSRSGDYTCESTSKVLGLG